MCLFTNFSYPVCTSVVTGGMWGQAYTERKDSPGLV
ncbi:hypothetical protein FOPG_19781 [Fusarium oxysporum f. sp. conglutinans race 2 54008]|uniref:Uncharacterized protein n=1 Tax=Fusarium oxysporum f. sp. conglutinans race 2 54008 TaxID=1089457 RepID=X0HRY9_FUSOX|nr:hypothetical protein FOPG_19781 [Fusarium oxysporum f. sp. conglutinans race 2 54008]